MRILLTGGAGFIGSHLVERLMALGRDPIIYDNLHAGQLGNLPLGQRTAYLGSDCCDSPELGDAAQGCQFVYHLAATVGVKRVLADPAECIRNNVDSLKAVLGLGVPGIFTSTSEVYGKTTGPLREDSELRYSSAARWAYAASKLVGEWMALQAGWKVVRLFNVVGPRQNMEYGAVLPKFVSQAISGEPLTIYGNGNQIRTFIDVRDCVEILDRLRTVDFDIVNVGGQHQRTIAQLADVVASHVNPAAKSTYVPYSSAYGLGFEECSERIPDLSKLKKLLGNLPSRPLKETILALAESLKPRKEEPCPALAE